MKSTGANLFDARRDAEVDRREILAHVFGREPDHANRRATVAEQSTTPPTLDAIAFEQRARAFVQRKRGRELLEEHGLGYAADRQIRQLSKGMAQQVQLLGTLVHEPRLVVFDEPFSGLDALNQGKLEKMIRALAAKGATVIFSTHVIAHAERLCDEVAIIAGGKVPFAGPVDVARDRIRPQVRLETRAQDGP